MSPEAAARWRSRSPIRQIRAAVSRVIREIWQGPRYSGSQKDLLHGAPVWFGMEPGANLSGFYVPPPILGPGGGLGLATTYQLSDGSWSGAPFIPSADWFQRWLTQNPNFVYVYTDLTYEDYWKDFLESSEYDYALAGSVTPSRSSATSSPPASGTAALRDLAVSPRPTRCSRSLTGSRTARHPRS